MFNPSRDQVRSFFIDTWRKARAKEVLTPMETIAADIIALHPEYHAVVEDPEAVHRDFPPEAGQINPFLHLSLHLAIAEQISIDQPPGIKAAYFALRRTLEVHDAEHAIMECLGETLWRAQRNNAPMEGEAYLDCVRRKAGG